MVFSLHPQPGQVLDRVLARARALGARAVLVFDLDSTLFDNRPRQVRILREFGEHKAIPELVANQVAHWKSGWDLRGAMVNAGLPPERAQALLEEAKTFWRARFFTSAYSVLDEAVPGAATFLEAAKATGAQLVYLTGRHEPMRAGSVEAMTRCGMPVPDGTQVRLLMKPTLDEPDDAFKARAVAEVRRLGEVVAAFDNEPTHANGYRQSFPDSQVVHLATDHSGRPVELLAGIVSISDFCH